METKLKNGCSYYCSNRNEYLHSFKSKQAEKKAEIAQKFLIQLRYLCQAFFASHVQYKNHTMETHFGFIIYR